MEALGRKWGWLDPPAPAYSGGRQEVERVLRRVCNPRGGLQRHKARERGIQFTTVLHMGAAAATGWIHAFEQQGASDL